MFLDASLQAALISAFIALIGYLITTEKARHQLRVEQEKVKIALADLKIKERDIDNKTREVEAQIRNTESDLKLKERELLTLRVQVMQRLDEIRQQQFLEVLRSRLEAYPKIYSMLQEFNRIWRYSKKPLDHEWAKLFLESILDYNAHYGVLFSQDVYSAYAALRDVLYDLEFKLRNGGVASDEDIEVIDGIISGPLNDSRTKRDKGLGTYMKDDLGSYRKLFISARE